MGWGRSQRRSHLFLELTFNNSILLKPSWTEPDPRLIRCVCLCVCVCVCNLQQMYCIERTLQLREKLQESRGKQALCSPSTRRRHSGTIVGRSSSSHSNIVIPI